MCKNTSLPSVLCTILVRVRDRVGVSARDIGNRKKWAFCCCLFLRAVSVSHISWGIPSAGQRKWAEDFQIFFHSYLSFVFLLEPPLSSDDLRSTWFGCIKTILVDFRYENNIYIIMTIKFTYIRFFCTVNWVLGC